MDFKKGLFLLFVNSLVGTSAIKKTRILEDLKDWIDEGKVPTDYQGSLTLFETGPCDGMPGSIWNYKYSGDKSKRKARFNGNFITLTLGNKVPKHGYDHGLKSGICLRTFDNSIKVISGSFRNGALYGKGSVRFQNDTVVEGTFVDGKLVEYFVRVYGAEKEKRERVLREIRFEKYSYTIIDNKSAFLFKTFKDGKGVYFNEETSVKGRVLPKHKNFLTDAVRVNILGFQNLDGILIPIVREIEESSFDFDVYKGKRINRASSMLREYIEAVKDEKISLASINYEDKMSFEANGVPFLKDLRRYSNSECKNCYRATNFFEETDRTFYTDNENLLGKQVLQYISPDDNQGVVHVKEITGNFTEFGILNGFITIKFTDEKFIEGFVKDNYLHGPVRTTVPTRRENGPSFSLLKDTKFFVESLIFYNNGRRAGPSYCFSPDSEAFFYDEDEKDGRRFFILLFKDETQTTMCYYGKFDGNKLMKGSLVELTGADRNLLEFSPISENVYLANEPLVEPITPDPFEEKYVSINKSTTSVGEGLFAKVDIPKDQVFSYFGGYRATIDEWRDMQLLDPEYWMHIENTNEVIYLPDEMGRNISEYRATMAHKINHSFSNFNCIFVPIIHPRYAKKIPAVKAVEDISAGSEILALYPFKFHEGSPWFQDLWKENFDDDPRNDHAIGPGGPKEVLSEYIEPMLSDSFIYKKFVDFALNELKLSPLK